MAAIERTRHPRRGFTLMELMVVISIITIFVGVIGYGFLRGSASSTVGLQASQSMILALLTQARSEAIAAGRDVALLVHVDPSVPERYLRFVVPAVVPEGSDPWKPLSAGHYLPSGSFVVPPVTPDVGARFDSVSLWSDYRSTAFRDPVDAAIESSGDQAWLRITFKSVGTTSAGQIVVAAGNSRPTTDEDPIPFEFSNVNAVRGVELSTYGQARLVNERSGFLPN